VALLANFRVKVNVAYLVVPSSTDECHLSCGFVLSMLAMTATR